MPTINSKTQNFMPQTITLIESPDGIKAGRYQRLVNIGRNEKLTPFEVDELVMCALYDVTPEDLNDSDPEDYKKLKASLVNLAIPADLRPKQRIEANGKLYQVIDLDPKTISAAAYLEILAVKDLTAYKRMQTLTHIVSMVVRPVKKRSFLGRTFYRPQPFNKQEMPQYEEDLREANIIDLFSILKFFEVAYLVCTRAIINKHKEAIINACEAQGFSREETEAKLLAANEAANELLPLK